MGPSPLLNGWSLGVKVCDTKLTRSHPESVVTTTFRGSLQRHISVQTLSHGRTNIFSDTNSVKPSFCLLFTSSGVMSLESGCLIRNGPSTLFTIVGPGGVRRVTFGRNTVPGSTDCTRNPKILLMRISIRSIIRTSGQ